MVRLFNNKRILLFAAFTAISAQPLSAQIGSATISGSVTDSTGAAVSAATVTALNVANNFRRVTTSNAVGQYSLPGLTPGAYNLTVELQGFKKFQQTAMTLQVDQNAVIDVVLEVGQVTEIVEVQGQAPLVESAGASMGAVIDTQKITTLPLNGRNFVQLALLVPGANTGRSRRLEWWRVFRGRRAIRAECFSDRWDVQLGFLPEPGQRHSQYRRDSRVQDPNQQLLRRIRERRGRTGESGNPLGHARVPRNVIRVLAE